MKAERPVVGIDASLRGLAIADGARDLELIEEWSSPAGDSKILTARIARYEELARHALERCRKVGPELVLIEHYAFSKGASAHYIGEFGFWLRRQLLDIADDVVEVNPSSLKQFATGKGNAGKPAVISYLTRDYGQTFDTDNQADAFALFRMGLCLAGRAEPLRKTQQKALEAVRKTLEAGRAARG